MFGKKKKNENNKLFEKLCLLLLEDYPPNKVDREEMLEICETAENMEYIIRNWKTLKPEESEEESGTDNEEGSII